MTPEEHCGLRERKKQATLRALRQTAVRLAAARGVDEITVEQICNDVGVSPRTFFNYFSSKEEALAGEPPRPPEDERLAEFEAGGPSGDLVEDLRAVLVPHLAANVPPAAEIRQRHQLVERDPRLHIRFHGAFMEIENRLVAALAARLGTDPDDVEAQVLGVTVASAMRTAISRWMADGGTRPLEAHADEVFDVLARRLDTT
jgi:AcrR family transcriptional regulator